MIKDRKEEEEVKMTTMHFTANLWHFHRENHRQNENINTTRSLEPFDTKELGKVILF